MREKYNYTLAWKNPFKIYNIKDWIKFRNGVKIVNLIIFAFISFIFYMLDKKLQLSTYLGVSYYVLPFVLTYLLVTRNLDGKNFFLFFKDYIIWKYNSKITNKTYAYDKKVLYRKRNNKFI